MEGLCRLCQERKNLIKAHIIPRGFFKYLYPEDISKPLHIVALDGGYVNSATGEFDPDILCSDCDNKIGYYDDYAQTIFLKNEPETIAKSDEATLISSIDYQRLKLFFISLLWRASISNRKFFVNINVGPFEESLRSLLESGDPGAIQDFGVVVTRFTSVKFENVKEKSITVPISHKVANGINVCVFYLPRGYKAYVKVDHRNFDQILAQMIIAPDRPLYILNAGNFDTSPEFRTLLNAIKKRTL